VQGGLRASPRGSRWVLGWSQSSGTVADAVGAGGSGAGWELGPGPPCNPHIIPAAVGQPPAGD